MSQYVDTLARDLGIKTNRKSNPISEMFATYRPRDYRGLIDEYLGAKRAAAGRTNLVTSTVKISPWFLGDRTFSVLRYILLMSVAVLAIKLF